VTDSPDTPDTPDTSGRPVSPGAGVPSGGGLPGLGDLGGLFESAQQALSAQAEAAERTVEGTAGGGVVTVTMTGAGAVTAVTLAPEVVDPDDIEMLQDLIVAALHDAGLKVTELQRQALGALGGLDIGGIGQMLGGLGGGTAPIPAAGQDPAGGAGARPDDDSQPGSGPPAGGPRPD
jgi:nucleoid-associated protein EbfC